MAVHTSSTEIAPNVYKLVVAPSPHFEFSQFLLDDERPCLVHAGKSSLFSELLPLVKSVLGERALDYLVFSHVEADESGAANEWLRQYPTAKVVCNKIANISLDNSLDRPAQIIGDGDFISLGEMKLRMIETPHFPHNWDAHLWYEEKNKVLFSSDFCCQGGISEPIVSQEITSSVIEFYEKGGFMPYGQSTMSALNKLDALPFDIIAPMHGSVIGGQAARTTFDNVSRDLKTRSLV